MTVECNLKYMRFSCLFFDVDQLSLFRNQKINYENESFNFIAILLEELDRYMQISVN